MPGGFQSIGYYGEDGKNYHWSSFTAGGYLRWEAEGSPMAFDMPIMRMEQVGDPTYMTHAAMVADCEARLMHMHGRVYRNYDGDLDLYIKFAFDDHIYHYQLVMPPMATGADYSEDDPYPTPQQYYLATGKTYVRRYTPAEWAAM